MITPPKNRLATERTMRPLNEGAAPACEGTKLLRVPRTAHQIYIHIYMYRYVKQLTTMVTRMESKTRTPVRDLNARAAAQRYAALQFAHYMWFTTYTYLYLYNYHMYIYIYCTYMHAEIYNVHRTTLGRHKTNMLKLAAR